MYLTPEILRNYLSETLGDILIVGNTCQRFKDVRFYAEDETHTYEYLYLLSAKDAESVIDFPFNTIVPAGREAKLSMSPAETCVIFVSCNPDRLMNLVRECFSTYNEWFRSIYEAIALNEKLEAILEKCYPFLRNPFFIDDSSYRTLARLTDYSSDRFDDNEYIFMQQSGHHSAEYIYAMLNSNVAVESSAISPRSIIHKFDFLSHRTLYSTIKVQGEIVGYFSCLELETELNTGIVDTFELLTELLSLALSRETYIPVTRQKSLNNDLILGILNGDIVDEELTKTAFSQMGLSKGAYFVSYITTNVDVMQNPFLLPRIIELLISNLENSSFAVADGSNIVLVINSRLNESMKEKLTQIVQFYLREFEVIIGLSLELEDPLYLPFYYDQALAATRLGSLLSKSARVFEYSDILMYDLLERFGSNDRRRVICHPAIFTLMHYDEEKRTQLLHTLKTYIECMGDTGKTSERLYLHRNSIYYRLQQIISLTGIDLQDEHILSHIKLSLRIMELDGHTRFCFQI